MTYWLQYDPATGNIVNYGKICSTPDQEKTLVEAIADSVTVPIEPTQSWLKNAHVDVATKTVIGLPS